MLPDPIAYYLQDMRRPSAATTLISIKQQHTGPCINHVLIQSVQIMNRETMNGMNIMVQV